MMPLMVMQEEPEELRRPHPEMGAQPLGRRQHIQEHAVERHAAGEHQGHEACVAQQLGVAAHQVHRVEGLPLAGVQTLGQPARVDRDQQHTHAGQDPEDRVPAQVHEQEPAHHRRNGRGHAEEDRDLRHHPLRITGREHVADDGARNHDARARRHALQRPEPHQRADGLRQRAAHAGQGEQRQAGQHDRPPAQRVGQRAVEQVHQRKTEQVGTERLLHLRRRGAQRLRNALEGRQVGIDRERPQRAQAARSMASVQRGPGHRWFESGCIGRYWGSSARPISGWVFAFGD
jgi:hypothetical protein